MTNLNDVAITCPCGQKCRGVSKGRFGHVKIPVCFLSYRGKKIPLELNSYFKSEMDDGFLKNLFITAIIKVAPAMDEILNAEYQTFQCPGCGCEVYFSLWDDAHGSRKCKRVLDTSKC